MQINLEFEVDQNVYFYCSGSTNDKSQFQHLVEFFNQFQSAVVLVLKAVKMLRMLLLVEVL